MSKFYREVPHYVASYFNRLTNITVTGKTGKENQMSRLDPVTKSVDVLKLK